MSAEIELHPDQQRAVDMAVARKLCRIVGPPGSGKSTILREVARALVRTGAQSALWLGPTGKSVMVIQRGVGAETAMTIAKMPASPDVVRRFRGCSVVVDEASMASLAHLNSIVVELDPSRLVLVGDVEQLSPVGGTSVLFDTGAVPWVPTTFLSAVFRHAQGTALFANLGLVRSGAHLCADAFTCDDSFARLPRTDRDTDRKIADLCAATNPPPQVICMTNGTRRRLNKLVQARVNPRGQPFPRPYDGSCGEGKDPFDEIRVGDPVVCRNNAYEQKIPRAGRKRRSPGDNVPGDEDEEEAPGTGAGAGGMLVSNGTLGEARCENGKPFVRYFTVDAQGHPATYDDHYDFTTKRFRTRKFQCAYAVTVDTSQGSQYPEVVLVLDDDSRYIAREHLYVGISRAQRRCVLVCDDGAVEKATRPSRGDPASALATALCEFDFREFDTV